MKKILLLLAVVAMVLPGCKKINEAIDGLDNRLDALENETIPTIDEQIAAIQTSIKALEEIDKSLDESIKALEESDKATAEEIAALKDADKAIEDKIEELKKYIDNALKSTKDWVTATFATLEQLYALSSEVETLKSLVDANKTEAAANLATAISNLEASLKSWVGEQLSNYYTIAEIDAKIAELQKAITDGDSALQQQLNELKSQLETTKLEVTEAYKKAIKEAIETNNGVINQKIANEIATVNKRIDEEVAAINAKIATLEAQVNKNTEDIAKLLARIQSVSYIPEYADGKVVITRMGSTSSGELSFRISPKDAVVELDKVWSEALSCEAYYPKTRAVSLVKLAVTEYVADAESGVITVKISGEGLSEEFFAGTQEAKVALVISDGNNQVVSDYADAVSKEIIEEKPANNEITISPENLTFGCNGGEQAVAITANLEYEVAERASWLTVEQTDEGLLVIVDANKNTSERSAFISITNSQYDINKSIEVYQEGYIPKIELAQQSVEVEFEPAEYEVAVTSPYSWEATTKNDWIVVESETGIAGDEKLKFTTLRNEEEKERKGTITLKNTDYNLVAELYVTQKAFVPAITIEPESLAFAEEGDTQEIAITANFDEYEYSTNADWLTIKKSEKGVMVNTKANASFEERTAEIAISNKKYGISKTISVTQKGISKNVIIYTSSDGKIVTPNKSNVFGANILSNTYENGKGVIVFDAPVTSIGEAAFYYCKSLTSITIPDSVTSIGNDTFSNCTSLTSATIGNRVTSIGSWAFQDCTSLTSVTIPNSVTSIGYYAFYKCSSLTSVTIPDSVTNIGIYAFTSCSSLTSVTIPDSVTRIGDAAFNSCSSLKSVTIGNSVTSIGEFAFSHCTSLKSVYCKPTTPPRGDTYMLNDNASGRKIYVPRNSVNAYKSASYWSDYASYIVGYDF